MPLALQSDKKVLPFIIAHAANPVSRAVGLLGTNEPLRNFLLLFSPCRSIHTFGMRYPLDAIAVDANGKILEIVPNIAPKKMVFFPQGTRSVIEGAAGWTTEAGLKLGSRVQIEIDRRHKIHPDSLRSLLHWPLNFLLAVFWFRLVLALTSALRQDVTFLNTAVLVHNSLLMFFFLIRRESRQTSRKVLDWLIPFAVLLAAMSFRPFHSAVVPLAIAIGVQSIGIIGVIFSLGSLGRSFGIIPANRSIQRCGAYRIVRHPLYSAEIFFYFGYVLGNTSLWNIALLFFIMAGQFWRAIAEEKLLLQDPAYRDYVSAVRYRFIPKVL
ncbi:MAG: DUF192 domain-containing protein [candidate division KSB1 bacterium]|nr:DUF192 domain-containing protein [candidate division KSB1 bacterium]